jgi:hypothetical protein
MTTYFIKRGTPDERGCTDEDTLHRMAAAKCLAPDDLVWVEGETPGWVRAAAVPGLFPEPQPPPPPEPAKPKVTLAPPVASTSQSIRAPQARRRPFSGKAPLLLTLILMGASAAYWLPRVYVTMMAAPRVQRPLEPAAFASGVPEPASTRDWTPELDNLRHLLDRVDIGTARAMLEGIQAVGCDAPELAPLVEQLRSLEADEAYVQKQRQALDNSKLVWEAMDPLVAAARRLRLLPTLRQHVDRLLGKSGVGVVQVSQVMGLGLAMGDSDVVSRAVAWVAQAPPEALIVAPFWPVLERLDEREQRDVAEALCRALLQAHPRDSRLGFELAAQLCLQEREDEALGTLKTAAKYGSEAEKRRAADDPRFTSLRDHSRFKRYLK